MPAVILVPREKSPHIISNKKGNELECLAQLEILCIMCLDAMKTFSD